MIEQSADTEKIAKRAREVIEETSGSGLRRGGRDRKESSGAGGGADQAFK
jgi:hypothetical protein